MRESDINNKEDLERFERAAKVFETRRSADEWEEVEGPAIPSTKHTKLVSLRLPLDLYSMVVAESEKTGRSFSDVVRSCLRRDVDSSYSRNTIIDRISVLESKILDRLEWLEKQVAEIPAQSVGVRTIARSTEQEPYRRFGFVQSDVSHQVLAMFRLRGTHVSEDLEKETNK